MYKMPIPELLIVPAFVTFPVTVGVTPLVPTMQSIVVPAGLV